MNQYIPNWNVDGDLPDINQKKTSGPENGLVELLWRNGQVILHNQTQMRKQVPDINDSGQLRKQIEPTLRGIGSCGNSSGLVQEDETVSWLQYPLEDSFEKYLYSNFFSELPQSDLIAADKTSTQVEQDKFNKFGASCATSISLQTHNKQSSIHEIPRNPMPPPRTQIADQTKQNHQPGFEKVVSFSQFSGPLRGDLVNANGNQGEVRECSVMTVGSSHCGSNLVMNDPDMSRASSNGGGTTAGLTSGPLKDHGLNMVSQAEGGKTETPDPTLTSSSSGGSGSTFGRTCKQSVGIRKKRKSRDAEESECQSKAAEHESAAGNKPVQRSGSARRSRTAEVHNLSERRRRDRINEKMRALQELIPHCNKTDKASMLDEAIEYLKSLQLQLQVMWMGNGMAPMMFPGIQHYMPRMSMGLGPPHLPSMNLSRVPLVDQPISITPPQNQAIMCQTQVLNQMQNPNFQDQYARYLGFHHLQAASQPMNVYRYGSQIGQQSQTMAPVVINGGQATTATDHDPPSGKTG